LYSRLLDKSKHVKVWISRAQFESDIGQLDLARAAFAEAENYFKAESLKEERVIILEAWYEFEKRFGDSESQSRLQGKLPQRVKRKRALYGSDGSEIGVEEYFDYTFPEEVSVAPGLRLLQAAKQWKSKVSTVDQ
jgi:crooked neck